MVYSEGGFGLFGGGKWLIWGFWLIRQINQKKPSDELSLLPALNTYKVGGRLQWTGGVIPQAFYHLSRRIGRFNHANLLPYSPQ